jgi:hypothetical protein
MLVHSPVSIDVIRYELYEILFSNGKRYFGISNDHRRRFREHQKLAKAGSWFPVHAAMRKYGHSIRLVVVGDKAYVQSLEISLIAAHQTLKRSRGYNVAPGGEISPMHNPEVAKRVAAAKRGKPISEATYEGGRRWLAENRETHVAKLSEVHKARWAAMPEEERIAWGMRQRGRPSPTKGVKVTDPVKLQRIRDAAKNRGPDWLKNVGDASRRAGFTPGRERQLADARKNVDYQAVNAASVAVTKGTIWITDGKTSRRVPPDTLVLKGWRRGKTHTRRI